MSGGRVVSLARFRAKKHRAAKAAEQNGPRGYFRAVADVLIGSTHILPGDVVRYEPSDPVEPITVHRNVAADHDALRAAVRAGALAAFDPELPSAVTPG
jgi:hypothetical protein